MKKTFAIMGFCLLCFTGSLLAQQGGYTPLTFQQRQKIGTMLGLGGYPSGPGGQFKGTANETKVIPHEAQSPVYFVFIKNTTNFIVYDDSPSTGRAILVEYTYPGRTSSDPERVFVLDPAQSTQVQEIDFDFNYGATESFATNLENALSNFNETPASYNAQITALCEGVCSTDIVKTPCLECKSVAFLMTVR